jgi:hypothetical protein
MKPRAIKIPVLRPQPSLLDALDMAQGRLATHTFGKPTDPVFDVVTVDPPAARAPEAPQ